MAARGLDIPKVQHVIHYQVGAAGELWAFPVLNGEFLKQRLGEAGRNRKRNYWSQDLMEQGIPVASSDHQLQSLREQW